MVSRQRLGALRRIGARPVGRQDLGGATFLKYRLDTPPPAVDGPGALSGETP